MTRKLMLTLALLALAPAAALSALLLAASGTPKKNAAFAMSLPARATRTVIINNRTAGAVYFRINDSATTPTASATLYDLALDQNELATLDRELLVANPVGVIGVFCADTTPTIRITGY